MNAFSKANIVAPDRKPRRPKNCAILGLHEINFEAIMLITAGFLN
jgi:hypothetical protein